MTGEQHKLYLGILRLMATFGTGGATWRRTRTSGGTPAADATTAQTSGLILRFCQNNRVSRADSLPRIPIFNAPWWGVASADVDIVTDDIFDNGTIAFLVTGTPDSSQGFLVIPAGLATVPAAVQAGYRSPLWILGIAAA